MREARTGARLLLPYYTDIAFSEACLDHPADKVEATTTKAKKLESIIILEAL